MTGVYTHLGHAMDRHAARAQSLYAENEHNLSRGTEEILSRYYGGELLPLTEADLLGMEVARGEITFEAACSELTSSRLREELQASTRTAAEHAIAKEVADAVTRAQMRKDMLSTGRVVAEPRKDMSPRMAALLGIDPMRPLTTDEATSLLEGLRADGLPIPGKRMAAPWASLAEIFGLDPTGKRPTGEQFDNIMKGLRADGTSHDASLLRNKDSTLEATRRRLLSVYGVPSHREPDAEEIGRMRRGMSAVENGKLTDKVYLRAITSTHPPVHYIGQRIAPDKSVSIAWALAPTEAERAIILNIHKRAVAAALTYLEQRCGHKRLGHDGSAGTEPGEIGWYGYTHYTARPAAEIVQMGDDQKPYTALQQVPINQPNPHLHDHIFIANAVLTESGKVGSLDGDEIVQATREVGAVYQAYIAKFSREHGIDITLGPSGEARFAAIPDRMRTHFSKRSVNGEEAARELAKERGKDWDALPDNARVAFLKQVMRETMLKKREMPSDFVAWQKEAEEAGYKHRSVLRPNEIRPELPAEARREKAYEVTQPLVSEAFEKRAKIAGQDMREIAARGLIVAGLDDPGSDIKAVLNTYWKQGISQEGEQTGLIIGSEGLLRGKEKWSVTTALGVRRESEVIELAREGVSDRTQALSSAQITAATDRYLAAHPNIDPESPVWTGQKAMIHTLGEGGRVAIGIGSAGAGKTTLLNPLVDAYKQDGRSVYGLAIAWRAATALGEAGVDKANKAALAAFFKRVETGAYKLDSNSVVIVDEVSLIGTRQFLDLLRLRKEHGFTLVAVGDQRQCASVAAGGVIDLIDRALPGVIPEITKSIRQRSERERDIVGMFRDGRIEEALEAKRKDKTAEVVIGGRNTTLARLGQLWRQRMEANVGDPEFSLTVSAPTRADARAVSAVIREEMRAMGKLGPDLITLKAVDNAGDRFDLPLAVGDRVQTFKQIRITREDQIAANGQTLDVLDVRPGGLLLKATSTGREAFVGWDLMRDDNGLTKLSHGMCSTIDTAQGLTSDEHINALPSGSAQTHVLKNYVASSRHRIASWIIIDEASERRSITERNPSLMPTREDVWNHIVANFKREPTKASALDFVKTASKLRYGAISARYAGLHRQEQREADRQEARNTEIRPPLPVREMPSTSDTPMPIEPPRRELSKVSAADVQAAFARALEDEGFRLKGAPVMDGKWHRAAVDGDKGAQKSGGYRGWASGGIMNNFRGGEPVTWRPQGTYEAPARQADQAAAREARIHAQAEQRAREAKVAGVAAAAWNAARWAHPAHEYLVRKQIDSTGLKQGAAGQTVPMTDGKEMKIGGKLLVPLRDADGKLWNLQIISNDGSKLFLPGRKKGLSFTIGPMTPTDPVLIAEGVATAKTLYNTTSLTTVAAIDSGNLLSIAAALRATYPEKPIILAADNDHHLPRREKPLANVGIEKAKAAAAQVGGVVISPVFDAADSGTDWNDLFVSHGRKTARAAIEQAFDSRGILPLLPFDGSTTRHVWTARADMERRQLSKALSVQQPVGQVREIGQRVAHQERGPTISR